MRLGADVVRGEVVASADWHAARFAEFCLYELASGGPDPHMRYVGHMSRDVDWAERAWRIGLYVAVYNVPTAEVIWQHWPWAKVWPDLQSKTPMFPRWIGTKWPGFQIRRERRAARTREKMVASLIELATWSAYDLPRLANGGLPADGEAAYEVMWAESSEILYFGRYAQTKLLEAYRRYLPLRITTPDVRPEGGWSPRTTLNLLTRETDDVHVNGKRVLERANWAAARVRSDLSVRIGLMLDYFRLEVLLCEYHESYHGKRQYPGRSNDSELRYLRKVQAVWPDYETQMLNARRELCPAQVLGETNGWEGPRENLGPMLATSGEVWSDLLWEYRADSVFKARNMGPASITALARNAMEGDLAHL
jgi:hypothetical protein